MMSVTDMFAFLEARAPISQEAFRAQSHHLSDVKFGKSEFLVKPGETPEHMYFILEGIVRIYFVDQNGREFTKIFRGPGTFVGPYSEALAKTKTRYFIQATIASTLIRFPFPVLRKLMSESHSWETLSRVIAEENYLEKEKREYMLIHMDIEEKYREFLKDYKAYKNDIPQYQIASYLGVSAEAFNRYLKKK